MTRNKKGIVMKLSRPEPPRRLIINGRFLSQSITGVQRYANEMVRSMDQALSEWSGPTGAMDHIDIVLAVPPNATPFDGVLQRIRTMRVGQRGGQTWEQAELCHFAWNDVLVSLANSGPIFHPRQIVCIHDAAVHAKPENYSRTFRTWYRILHRALTRRVHRLATVSSFSASELATYYGVDAKTVAILPNSAEHIRSVVSQPGILDRHGLKPGNYVFAVGGYSRSKNVAVLEQAMSFLPEPRPQLVVAGRRNGRVFSHASGPQGLSDNDLVDVGEVSDGELKALYENAMCFVFPSLYEGFGIPPLEAMNCGCPVIVSRAGALPEVCSSAALYCHPTDPQDIARAIAALMTDGALRAALAETGMARAKGFQWMQSATRLLDMAAVALDIRTPLPAHDPEEEPGVPTPSKC
jgi:Glycosyltransferase